MSWLLSNPSDAEWDDTITRLGIVSPYQLSAWSQFRSTHGWQSLRLVRSDGSAAIQFLTTRRAGVIDVAWSPGGPAGTTVSSATFRTLAEAVKESLRGGVCYVRISDARPWFSGTDSEYRAGGWQACSSRLSAPRTLLLQIPGDPRALSANYSTNWSRNLRRGEQRGIVSEVWEKPDAEEISRLYCDVADLKRGVTRDWRTRADDVVRFIECFGSRLVMIRSFDTDGKTLAYRGAIHAGRTAFDILAASSLAGRKSYASHVATHGLLSELSRRNCEQFDFGGIDPATNKGVFDFKHGTGGTEHRYGGEYHLSQPRVLKTLVSKLGISRIA